MLLIALHSRIVRVFVFFFCLVSHNTPFHSDTYLVFWREQFDEPSDPLASQRLSLPALYHLYKLIVAHLELLPEYVNIHAPFQIE